MKILIYLGHPAHFHLFKNVITKLKNRAHTVFILTKKKDILDNLLQMAGFEYNNILKEGRKDTKLGIAVGLLKREFKLLSFCLKNRPTLLCGTSVEISHIGKLLGIPSINVNEDDAVVVPAYAKVAYPLASVVVTPTTCNNGVWQDKSVKYSGYHELAYLHPNHFTPDREVVRKYFDPDKPYFIIRFAKLTAHHDHGIQGITDSFALQIIKKLKPHGTVYITSEREFSQELEPYRIAINPLDIHHVMAFAKLYIGDSQTMAAEAGVLGTPFIRFNDFVGRIGYLNELENVYQLGFGIKPAQPYELLSKIDELLKYQNLKAEFQTRRQRMLSEKIDVAKFLTWFIENYPKSVKILKENPDYQYNFK